MEDRACGRETIIRCGKPGYRGERESVEDRESVGENERGLEV